MSRQGRSFSKPPKLREFRAQHDRREARFEFSPDTDSELGGFPGPSSCVRRAESSAVSLGRLRERAFKSGSLFGRERERRASLRQRHRVVGARTLAKFRFRSLVSPLSRVSFFVRLHGVRLRLQMVHREKHGSFSAVVFFQAQEGYKL